jgi:hypothetical protein
VNFSGNIVILHVTMRRSLSLFLCSLLFCGCESAADLGDRYHETRENGEPVVTFDSPRWTEQLLVGQMQFQAGKLILKGEPQFRRIILRDLLIVLRNKKQAESLRVEAGYLFLLPDMDQVELSDHVLVKNTSGVELEADSLEFHMQERILEGSGNIRLITPEYILEGGAIITNVSLSAYEISGVKGYLRLEAGDTLDSPSQKE